MHWYTSIQRAPAEAGGRYFGIFARRCLDSHILCGRKLSDRGITMVFLFQVKLHQAHPPFSFSFSKLVQRALSDSVLLTSVTAKRDRRTPPEASLVLCHL